MTPYCRGTYGVTIGGGDSNVPLTMSMAMAPVMWDKGFPTHLLET